MKITSFSDEMLLGFDYFREGITITNPNSTDNPLIYVNEGFCSMTGYTKKEILGKSCRFLQGNVFEHEGLIKLKAALRKKEDTVQELMNFKKDGTLFWNRLSITHIFDDSNKVSYIIGIQEDVTASKENEAIQRKIDNQKLIEKTTLIAEQKQKNEIGEELHDNVNQILATLKLYINVAINQKDRQTEMLEKSDEMIVFAIDEIRKLSRNLVSTSIKKECFQQTISELICSMQIALPFSIELIFDEAIEEHLSESLMLTFYRIIQEQLNNIIKYAKPTCVTIKFGMANDIINLSIKDDGVGFNKEITAQGIGLKNMSHRVEIEKGNFTVITSVGNGCEIKIDMPIV